MRRRNVLSSILLNIIVLNTATYNVYATNAQLRDNEQISPDSTELATFSKTNCEKNPNLVPNDKIIKNTNNEQNLSDKSQQCNNTKLKCNRRGSLDPSQVQLFKSVLNNNSETITSNEEYKTNGLCTSSVLYNKIMPNANMIKYNNVLHCNNVLHYNALEKLSITYPEISNEILINLVYNIELKSIQHSLNNILNCKNNISLDNIVFLLMKNSSTKYDTALALKDVHDILNSDDEEENDMLYNNIELLQNIKLKLIDYEKIYKLNNKTEDNIISYILKSIKDKKSNNISSTMFQNFITKLKKQLRKKINHILYLKKQYENIYGLESIIYTYSTLSFPSLLDKKNNIDNINYDNMQCEINKLTGKISDNLNGFYKDCLFGNNLPISKDLIEINNIIRELNNSKNEEDIINKLNTINNKVSDLEHNNANEWYMKYLTGDLKIIKNKISEVQNSMDFSNIKKALHPITLKLSEMSNYKLLIPINENILHWCEEKYEDWAELLSEYEYLVKYRNKTYEFTLNKKQESDKDNIYHNNKVLNQKTFYNMISAFYKIAIVNSQLENYHRTIKLLHNISNVKNKNQQYIFMY